jgi:hypothetical protein
MSDRDVAAAILRDLTPAPPLAPPWLRTLRFAPLALLLAAAIPFTFGLRSDFSAPVLLTSLAQFAAGVCFAGVALWDAIPGRTASPRPLWYAGAAGALTFLVAMTLTAPAGRFTIPPGAENVVFRVCLIFPVGLGLPILAVLVWLLFRGFPVRPAWTGALAGLGCGLIVESGWRSFCHYSDPGHVLSTHGAAVAILTLAGAAAAWQRARRSL